MKLLDRIFGKKSVIDIVVESKKDDEIGQSILEYIQNCDNMIITKDIYGGWYGFILSDIESGIKYNVRVFIRKQENSILQNLRYITIDDDVLDLSLNIVKEIYEEIVNISNNIKMRSKQKRLNDFKETLNKIIKK